jgi:hypothetical protein
MRWQKELPEVTDGEVRSYSQPFYISAPISRVKLPHPLPFFEATPSGGGVAGAPRRLGIHSKATGAW